MDLHAPFVGTLFLPDRVAKQRASAVMLPDGRPVAWLTWEKRLRRFEVLDPRGAVVARGRNQGIFLRDWYEVWLSRGGRVLVLSLHTWRGIDGKSTVTVPTGGPLAVQRGRGDRRFTIGDARQPVIGAISSTGGPPRSGPDSYALHIDRPVLTLVQAAGLAQCVRLAEKWSRETVDPGSTGGRGRSRSSDPQMSRSWRRR